MDLNTIMSNIYGENAPQNFDSLGLSGGRVTYKRANIKYLDEDRKPPIGNIDGEESELAIHQSFKASKLMSIVGGKLKKNDASIITSAEYVEDSDCQTFIKEFYLHYLITNPHKNMLLVIPSSSTLKTMVSDFKDRLKKEKIEPYTVEASRFAAKNDLPFKNYIFDVYGKDTNDNAGFVYQVPRDYPDKAVSDILRRTNRSSKQYYFKFGASGKITVSDSDKFSKTADLKFIAKCDRDVHVVKGDLPTISASKKSKVISASLAGGAKNKHMLAHEFLRSVRKYNNIDDAAYNFIARVSKASSPSNVAKYYSGDLVHCALSIIADNKLDIIEPSQNEILNEDDEHGKIIDNYTPKKSIVKMDKVKAVLPKILKYSEHSSTPQQANTTFVQSLSKMYSTVNAPDWMMKADVATSLIKNDDSIMGVKHAIETMNDIDCNNGCPCEGKGDDLNLSLSGGVKINGKMSTPFINSVYSALSSSPFIGLVAKEYTPLLNNSQKVDSKSAFEDKINFDNENDDDLNISSIEEKNDDNENHEEVKEDNETKEDDGVEPEAFDIKAFF